MKYSLNQAAVRIIKERILPYQEELNVRAFRSDCGVTVIDMGLKEKGGFLAAKLFSEAGMGGLGRMEYSSMRVGAHLVPAVLIHVDRPTIAELASHDAFLFYPYKGGTRSASGPCRAIRCQDPYVQASGYRDEKATEAVCHLQIHEMPGEETLLYLAEQSGVAPENLYVLVARTGGMTGAAQIAARNVEQVLPSLVDHGFDVHCIIEACGSAPLLCSADDETLAMGRVNDSLIYGQETNLYVRCADEEIERILPILPFNKNTDVYGTPFLDLFRRCDCQWTKVPRAWDAPCRVNFFNLATNHTFTAGALHHGVLESGFLG